MDKPIPTTILMPPELRQWVEDRAKAETRNITQQIVHLLSQQRAQIEAKTTEAA